jgi:hypothetical protein
LVASLDGERQSTPHHRSAHRGGQHTLPVPVLLLPLVVRLLQLVVVAASRLLLLPAARWTA